MVSAMDIKSFAKRGLQKVQSIVLPRAEAAASATKSTEKRKDNLYLSKRLSLEEIEKIYVQMLNSNFYDSNYGTEWNRGPYQLMADIIQEVFRPKRVIDLGCGLGYVIEALRNKAIDAEGIEFSPEICSKIDSTTQKHVKNIKVEDFFTNYSLRDYDLIMAMEVFEHLPVSIILKNLIKLREECTGTFFLTIPAFGHDCVFRTGIIRTNTEEWLYDIEMNQLFSHIAMHDGYPHHGHITLASYRWWTDFFLYNGFTRNYDLEKIMDRKYGDSLQQNNWNPFVLNRMQPNRVYFGSRWHEEEARESQISRWSSYNSDIFFMTDDKASVNLDFEYTLPEININMSHSIQYSLYSLEFDPSTYRFTYAVAANGTIEVPSHVERQRISRISLPVREGGKYILVFNTPLWQPAYYNISTDGRMLGYYFSRISIA